jgi:hypothetical protein
MPLIAILEIIPNSAKLAKVSCLARLERRPSQ